MPIRLEIVTAEKQVYSGDVDVIIAPGIDGELAILPRHAPLMTMLRPGELRLRQGGEETSLAVTGGFMEVRPDKVTVLADAAERADEIDIERAEAAMRRAEDRLMTHRNEIDVARAQAALQRSLARLKVAEKRRLRRRPGT